MLVLSFFITVIYVINDIGIRGVKFFLALVVVLECVIHIVQLYNDLRAGKLFLLEVLFFDMRYLLIIDISHHS